MKKFIMVCFVIFFVLTFFNCDPSGDGGTDPPVDNPVPQLTSISPTSKVAHLPSFTLTATGSNFVSSSGIIFDGTEIATTYVSATELTCRIEPGDTVALASMPDNGTGLSVPLNTTVPVLVRNPAPGGGDSGAKNFKIRDKHTFSPPIVISGSLIESFGADIAVDSAGNINVVWCDRTSTGNADIYYRRSIDFGATWGSIVNLSNTAGYSYSPSIVAENSGNVYVAWYNEASTWDQKIKFKGSSDSGATWGTTIAVSNYTGYAANPDIALDGSGNLNLVWSGGSAANIETYFSRSSDQGVTWSSFVNVSNTPGSSRSPVLAVDSSGNLNTAWFDYSPGNYDIYFSRSTDDGANWSSPANISNNAATSYAPAVAVDNDRNICLTWYDRNPGHWQVFFSRSTDNGVNWSAMQNVSQTSLPCSHPAIAVDSAANINMVWDKNTLFNEPIIFGRSIDNGANWSTPVELTDNPESSFSPEIALDSAGNIYVVWDDDGGPYNRFIYFTGSAH
jgi:hypothetical protein